MSDPLAITEDDAQGLALLAQAQLRLALRFAERAEAAEDTDEACRLARASERAARGYRQSLLIKSRLQRERDTRRRDIADNPVPRTPQEEARRNQRQRELYEAVERIVCETVEDPEELDFTLSLVLGHTEHLMAVDDDFADADLQSQVDRVCEDLGLLTDPPRTTDAPESGPPSPDSS